MKNLFQQLFKCSTRKASKWLDQKGLRYHLIDIIESPPSIKYLNIALKQYPLDKSKIFNTRGKSFKLINVDFNTITNPEICELLLNDGKLIKRPFLIYEERKVILGFNEFEYSRQIL